MVRLDTGQAFGMFGLVPPWVFQKPWVKVQLFPTKLVVTDFTV